MKIIAAIVVAAMFFGGCTTIPELPKCGKNVVELNKGKRD